VDVNGFKGPNTIGKDVFGVHLLKSGIIIPFGTQGDNAYNYISSNSCDIKQYPNTSGWKCSADYLKQ
jgi:hypothetical protein